MAAHSKVERFGSLDLPLGGTHGYVGVRKVRKGLFQGYTPKKRPGHFTKALKTAHAAAVARLTTSCLIHAKLMSRDACLCDHED